MEIEKTNGYGIAISDLEGNWDEAFKAKLKKTSQKIIFNHLSFFEKIKLISLFSKERKKTTQLELSDLRQKGMTNDLFIKQQLEYIAMFSALAKLCGLEKAKQIIFEVMEKTSVEAFSKSSPEHDAIINYGNSFEFFRKYMQPLPLACSKAGCLDMKLTENTENSFQFEIYWCVWLELAKRMNIPEACIPNCYADDHAYPDYFKQYGIQYSRKGTLATGHQCCDMRFEKI